MERPDLVPKGRVLLPTGPVFPFALPLTPRVPPEGRGLCPGHPAWHRGLCSRARHSAVWYWEVSVCCFAFSDEVLKLL